MKVKSAEFIALSACSMMLTALGIDIMLPVFSAVRIYFGLSAESTAPANIVVFFFLGQIAQLVFGVLSDRFGRRPILSIGFSLYIVGGMVAAFAPSLPVMFAARFVAGMGASAVFSTTIAGVRDRFVGDQMARTMSLVFTIFLFTPILAPFLGAAILAVSSWRVVFVVPPVFAILIFIWSLRLEESLPREKRVPINWISLRSSFAGVLTHRTFLRYTGVTTLLFAAFSSYIASSEYIIGEIYGRPQLFTWIFAGVGLLMALSTFSNAYFATHFGARRTIRGLIIVYTMLGGLLLLYTMLNGDPPNLWIFFIAVAPMLSINLAIEPNSSALAMEHLGDAAGVAAAVYGTSFFFVGASLGSIISHLMVTGVFPLVISFFTVGAIALVLVFGDKRKVK